MNKKFNHSPSDSAFENELQTQLRDSERNLDIDLADRLRCARHTALTAERPAMVVSWFSKPTYIAGLAAAAILAVLLWLPGPAPLPVEDAELNLALDNGWELYDDLDFYLWLAESEPG